MASDGEIGVGRELGDPLASLPSGFRDIVKFSLGLVEKGLTETIDLASKLESSRSLDDFEEKSKQFTDPAWKLNPYFAATKYAYRSTKRLSERLVADMGLGPNQKNQADVALSVFFGALSPNNFLLTNPTAIRKAFETGGLSLLSGARNFIDDLLHNGGLPSQVDKRPFKMGMNLAATPSKVVFKNELIELLQYLPQTEEVYATPLLASPPWINKYYIMDLAPDRSLIEWAVRAGHTTFAISYRNPTSDMSNYSLFDYLQKGPVAAIEAISEITGSSKVDLLALCLGGTLATATAAYFEAIGDKRIGTLTLLNTLLDFSDPGLLGAFADQGGVARLEKMMAGVGYLDGRYMARTFNLLRPSDMIFNYIGPNWLMGERPPAFDVLVWNGDYTRMPAKMHSEYLETCYLKNQFAKDEWSLGGIPIHPKKVQCDTYVLSAQNDHIVPWRSAYSATRLLGGEVRFVVSNGGHIAGVVNPPSAKAWYLASNSLPPAADHWMQSAVKHQESWWQDWAEWASTRSGPLTTPPSLGSKNHPILGDGPGEYVMEG